MSNKEVVGFYSGPDKQIKDLENRAKDETTENIQDNKKVFDVRISGEDFNINKYTNLSLLGNQLFTEKISLKEAKDQQKTINCN